MKNCNECRFAVLEDYGYSNYTVEGTNFSCALKLHPQGSFDRFYGHTPKMDYADECSNYSEGDPVWLDVDGENIDSFNLSQQFTYDIYKGNRDEP